MILKKGKDYKAVLKTSKGDVTVDLFEKETPVTVNNFVFLSKEGFYSNTRFHRIMKGFMIQGGDPLGNGTGDPGYKFSDEPITRDYTRGILAMANSGPNTNGSQFFIMHADYPLPKNYVIFGEVAEGMDVVDKIADTPVKENAFREKSDPLENVTVNSVEILED
ncbi:peptidylprolyl isomerase [candidate division WWE3 bacterium RIFCSPHIGHO2_01_FULL_40_23]|uniref:Peptidyl-prolyl cis-trans isomerase n=1 Tax=candidate division WWE3 bacterium RIFCSPLOWO2_01_FULL_41_18 TaxID=1802625 RepID=A0A1F4VDE7_UNCKA|nr:MAG: peptidylprolyl isomerase [candidate division WWE3 bacterium RIFCSPHIGHO2_01_FULL_40_23]OGC55302.1 MAG: peptidylprolyl isomerase [candidate division WWE3 bacterium RIFCSPLOWO2_01_FULL_41_18]